ncbi:hypothetical protein [Tahibacter soli]|jgi:hypothetical protein|uniref:Uncharacterized protein n=1 Tax=Tahibacter soli TaxID=2983605 RepID=A0A9X3YNK3_9GAMM|nr:hypothetical protein [Tahibacter soli]MDC8015592.1 hypothetical protein [Tahibacter soli]
MSSNSTASAAARHADPHHADPAVAAGRVLPARRQLLHEIRWRPPEIDRRRMRIALAIALVAQIVLMLLTREWMRPPAFGDRHASGVVQVRLIELPPPPDVAETAVHELPPLAVTAPPAGTARNAPAPPRPERAARPVAPPAPGEGAEAVVETPAAPTLYNADGSLKIAPRLALPAPPRDPIERGKLAARELSQRGHNVVRCKPTRFARAYSPDESAGAEFARKYGAYVGLYNAHTAKETADRAMEAVENCDAE